MSHECSTCSEEFNENEHRPMNLFCGHVFCKQCTSFFQRDVSGGQFKINCPNCRIERQCNEPLSTNFGILDIISQSITNTNHLKKCAECNESINKKHLAVCTTCVSSPICTTCILMKHQGHSWLSLADGKNQTSVVAHSRANNQLLPDDIKPKITEASKLLNSNFEESKQQNLISELRSKRITPVSHGSSAYFGALLDSLPSIPAPNNCSYTPQMNNPPVIQKQNDDTKPPRVILCRMILQNAVSADSVDYYAIVGYLNEKRLKKESFLISAELVGFVIGRNKSNFQSALNLPGVHEILVIHPIKPHGPFTIEIFADTKNNVRNARSVLEFTKRPYEMHTTMLRKIMSRNSLAEIFRDAGIATWCLSIPSLETTAKLDPRQFREKGCRVISKSTVSDMEAATTTIILFGTKTSIDNAFFLLDYRIKQMKAIEELELEQSQDLASYSQMLDSLEDFKLSAQSPKETQKKAKKIKMTGKTTIPMPMRRTIFFDDTSMKKPETIMKNRLIHLDFEHGTVIIDLDIEDCPKVSEFFVELVKKKPNVGMIETGSLEYMMKIVDDHELFTSERFDFQASGDKKKGREEREEWGLSCFFCSQYGTFFKLTKKSWKSLYYFGKVVQGNAILDMNLDRKFKLIGYGIV